MKHRTAFDTTSFSSSSRLHVSHVRRRVSAGGRVLSLLRSLVLRVLALLRAPRGSSALGPYRLVERIGQGGMGVVYKATHPLAERPLAIKLLSSERSSERDVKRFEREARLTRMLRHPNTIAVYDFGRTGDGAPYYVMEYLEGRDLQTLVESEGPQAPARVARVLAELAGALAEVHDLGLLHGDVKPANVVLCGPGGGDEHVKILDFGLAREIPGTGRRSASPAAEVAGTPLYLSPEALVAPEQVDGRSDLYAVGAIGYFLLTGVPPFSGKTALQVFLQHVHAAPVPPSKLAKRPIPPELEATILSCLAKAAGERPESAAALCRALLPLAA